MPEFTVKDALAVIETAITEQDAQFDDSVEVGSFSSRDAAHAARMALINVKNDILVAQIKLRSKTPTAELPPFPASSDHSPAPRRYLPLLAALTGGKWGVWDTERKGWVRITGYSPSAAEALSDQLNTPPVKI